MCGLSLHAEQRGLSVCLLVCHSREPCKTAKPIDVPFGLWVRLGTRNHVLDGDHNIPIGRDIFEREGDGPL